MPLNPTKIKARFGRLVLNGLQIAIVFGSVTAYGVKTEAKLEEKLMEYGADSKYNVSYIVPQSYFSAFPASGDKVSVNSVNYRVLGTKLDAADAAIILDLGAEYEI